VKADTHEGSELRVRCGWHEDNQLASRLLDAYYHAKRRAFAGGALLSTPDEWAGSMMVLYGNDAIAQFGAAKKMGIHIPKAKHVKKLLRAVFDAELALVHGDVTCHACDRKGPPTMQWRQRLDEEGERLWACARCAPTLVGAPV